MDTNIGTIDQLIRIAGLIIAAVVFLFHRDSGFISTASGFFVIYFFMTALTKYSPVWELFGISTIEKPKNIKTPAQSSD